MIFLKILGGIALFLLLVALIPVRIRVVYDKGIAAYIPVLFFKIRIYPRKPKLKSMSKKKYDKLTSPKKKKKKKKDKSKAPEQEPAADKAKERPGISGILGVVGDIKSAVGVILKRLNAYLKVKIYAFWINVSCDDAAKTAVTYGAVSGSVGTVMSIINDRCRVKYPKNAQTGVYCDYLSGHTSLKVDIRFSIFIWQIIAIGIKALLSFIKIKTKLEGKKDAGNKNQ